MYRTPLETPSKFLPVPDLPRIENIAGVYSLREAGLNDAHQVIDALLQPLRKDPIFAGHEEEQNEEKGAFPFTGGENEALKRLDHYFSGGKDAPGASYKETR